jgi:DNA-binding transcriptional LysR family regulator
MAASGAPSLRARWSSSTSSSSPPRSTGSASAPPTEVEKARIRLVIESVFSNLKRQMRLTDHLAKTTPGLAQRIAQRLLALTLGIFCNLLAGRPPRRSSPMRTCREHGGFDPDIRHRTNDATVSLALVARGQAVTLLPELALAGRDSDLALRAIAEGTVSRTIFAVTRTADAARPSTRALLAAMRNAATALSRAHLRP